MEQREHPRYQIALPGKLFLPAEDAGFECQVMNLSLGGAGVRCHELLPLQSFIILYIDGFGRFECITTQYVDGELGLRFACKHARSQRLLNGVLALISSGDRTSTRTRQHVRNAMVKWGHFVRPNGDNVYCQAIDLSAQGVSLRTDARPPNGELVKLGHVYGRVVRHHDEGIAIQFLEPSEGLFGAG